MSVLRVLAFMFLIAGCVMVFGAGWIVRRYKLDEKVEVDFENEMGELELKQYKSNKAIVNIKMLGMLIALPGVVLLVISTK